MAIFAPFIALWSWFTGLGWVRAIGLLIGAAFSGVVLISMLVNLASYFAAPPEPSIEHEFHLHPKNVAFSFEGPFGKYDNAQLQRGFQVYKEVCAACHGLSRVAFYDLHQLGYEEGQIKTIASEWAIEVPSVNPETGEPATRKALPSDRFPSPYANETAGRAANNNALPPDLSLMAKAREGGPEYIYSLLTGYRDAATYKNEKGEAVPAANRPGQGLHFNPYFANLNLAMPKPIVSDGQVTYAEGNPSPTVDQMAKDVSAFLMWAAEPKLTVRHQFGLVVMVFLLFATVLAYLSYRNIWAEAKRKVAPVGPLEPVNKARRARAKAKAGMTE